MSYKDPEKNRAYARAYRASHLEEMRAKDRAEARRARGPVYEKAHRTHRNFTHRLNVHAMTSEDYHRLLHRQGGVCAVCKTANWGSRGPHIDHDHGSNKVRGLLCMNCNVALGNFRDSARLLRLAAEYLERNDV